MSTVFHFFDMVAAVWLIGSLAVVCALDRHERLSDTGVLGFIVPACWGIARLLS